MSSQRNENRIKMGMGISLQMTPAIKIHQTIAQECAKHASCEECYKSNPEGPICGILYAPEIKEMRKLKIAFPKTFEDYVFF